MAPKRRGKPRSEMLCVRVTAVQRERLQQIADEDGATESEVIRRLLAAEIRKRLRSSS